MTYNELELLLNDTGLKKSDMCKETGISPQIITNAKSRGGHFSATTENKIRAFLEKHRPDYFMSMNNVESAIDLTRAPSSKEAIMLFCLSMLNEEGVDVAIKSLMDIVQTSEYRKKED